MLLGENEKTLRIPPLVSGGVMLSYRCSSACRHCLYRCSPRQPDEWLTLDGARRIFEALAAEPHFDGIHLAGGEATLRLDLLVDVIALACEMGIPIDYVETNAMWCADPEETREKMRRMRDAGLRAILISASMFHNEFVPFRRTRIGVEAAAEVFGPGGVFVYLAHVYQMLSRLPDEGRPHTLDEFCAAAGVRPNSREVLDLYSVIPGGRAAEALRDCYSKHLARHFRHEACRGELFSTTHFHIDHHLNLFTGLCGGLSTATADDLHPPITEESHPIFWRAAHAGPYGLLELARQHCGYDEKPDGYVSKCDLCLDVRRRLLETGDFEELRPAAFYEH